MGGEHAWTMQQAQAEADIQSSELCQVGLERPGRSSHGEGLSAVSCRSFAAYLLTCGGGQTREEEPRSCGTRQPLRWWQAIVIL